MTDNKRSTPDELRNAQDATFTTGEGKAPELGVKNASAEGSTYRPDWVPEDAKKDDTFACHVMKGVKEMHDGLLSSSTHLAPSVRPVQRRKKLTVADYVRGHPARYRVHNQRQLISFAAVRDVPPEPDEQS